jgi:hypothetical protein
MHIGALSVHEELFGSNNYDLKSPDATVILASG